MKRYLILLIFLVNSAFASPFLLPSQKILPYTCATCPKLSKTPLSTHWPLPRKALFDKSRHSEESRSWHQWVSGQALRDGLKIYTLGERALVRLTPAQPDIPLDWKNKLRIVSPQGKTLRLPQAGLSTDAGELPLGTEAAQNSLLLELAPELAHGRFTLKLHDAAIAPESRWQVSVYDQYASLYLHVETDKAQYRYGDFLSATVYMHDIARRYPIEMIEASLEVPGGQNHILTLKKLRPMVYRAILPLYDTNITQGENWTLKVFAYMQHDDQIVMRQAHTIFSYTVPSAKINALSKNNQDAWQFDATVKTAIASRYALQAVLYGYDEHGERQPAQLAQSADWLEKGEGVLHLRFSEDAMGGLKPPYAIGALKLSDLTQLKPVYYHAKPIAVEALS